jgi:DNA repair protein RadD
VDGGGRVLIATHRAELIGQDEKACLRFFEPRQARQTVGVYSAGLGRREVRHITVGGVQSLFSKTAKLGSVDVCIIDEAHLVPPKSDTQYGKLLDGLRIGNPDLRVMGLTATPYRLGQGVLTQGDGAIFSSVVYQADIKPLIADGYLAPLVSQGTKKQIDTTECRTSAGDWVAADLERAADVDDVTDAVVAEVIGTKRRHCLVYGVSVAHAGRMRGAFQMAGVAAACITGETPHSERQRILRDFASGAVQVLTSCDVLTTGLDVPVIDCIALVRPTQSAALYVQMCGRGTRLADGKQNCIVLDFGGNIARHGPIDAIQIPITGGSRGKGKDKTETKLCKGCFAENPIDALECVECSLEFPVRKTKVNDKASRLDILSSAEKPEPVQWQVDRVEWSEHISAKSEKKLLRVDYHGPGQQSAWHPIATDWVCLEHSGFARQKAESWWLRHCQGLPPETVAEALERRAERRPIMAIHTVPDGKYQKITAYTFGKIRQPGEDDEPLQNGASDQTDDDDDWAFNFGENVA